MQTLTAERDGIYTLKVVEEEETALKAFPDGGHYFAFLPTGFDQSLDKPGHA